MTRVVRLDQASAYVHLLEYNNIEGMIPFAELSRRRIRSLAKYIRVGRLEVVQVLTVDEEKGYIDLSKRKVTPDDRTLLPAPQSVVEVVLTAAGLPPADPRYLPLKKQAEALERHLQSPADNLLITVQTEYFAMRGLGQIDQGYLEMSNVAVVDEMVNMIVAQRAY